MGKRILSIVLSLVMCLTLLPVDALAVENTQETVTVEAFSEEEVQQETPAEETPAEGVSDEESTEETPAEKEEIQTKPRKLLGASEPQEKVPYLAYNETSKEFETAECESYTVMNLGRYGEQTIYSGWYVLDGGTVNGRITVSGDVNFILKNGTENTFKYGIGLHSGSTLRIYAQPEESGKTTGKLITSGKSDSGSSYSALLTSGAGIGGDYVLGSAREDTSCGRLYIYGGIFDITGCEYSAGIGGGQAGNADAGNGGEIYIYGGDVTAQGGEYAAGIGGGSADDDAGNGGSLYVYGGKVTAKGGINAAGIGGGTRSKDPIFGKAGTGGDGGRVVINGGEVIATGGEAKSSNIKSASSGAGIGGGQWGNGGEVTINGGTVIAHGGVNAAGIGGGDGGEGANVTISGGHVESYGSNYGAGIGGGNDKGCGGAVVISGGYVEAHGGYCAAGIGGGDEGHGGTVTISNAEVYAYGGAYGAGIGGGDKKSAGFVTIKSGEVYAYGGDYAAGIGGGSSDDGDGGDGANVRISGGAVKVVGGKNGAGIGGGDGGDSGDSDETVEISGGVLDITGGENANAIGAGAGGDNKSSVTVPSDCYVYDYTTQKLIKGHSSTDWSDQFFNRSYISRHIYKAYSGDPNQNVGPLGVVDYLAYDASTGNFSQKKTNIAEPVSRAGGVLTSGWYVVDSDYQLDEITIAGDVHLILENECDLTVLEGIHVPMLSSLTVYGQSTDEALMGTLTATGTDGRAGIGGTSGIAHSITINGGKITATGGTDAAGIGGDKAGIIVSVTINGGIVTANGGTNGAGIGSGNEGNNGTVTINGGIVTANGGTDGAGIGGGNKGNSGTMTINGGIVTANGGLHGAGIGGGELGTGGIVTINLTKEGEKVTATGGKFGAGIGGGDENAGGTVTIKSGEVEANGGDSAAGIGGGYGGSGGTVNVQGGTVTAKGGAYGAGIGGGSSGTGSTLTVSNGTIAATGGAYGAGIGGGLCADGGLVTLTGGIVTATGGTDAAGIGGSQTGNGADIKLNGNCTVTAEAGKNVSRAIGAGAGGASQGTISASNGIAVKDNNTGKMMMLTNISRDASVWFTAELTPIVYYEYYVTYFGELRTVAQGNFTDYNHITPFTTKLGNGFYVVEETVELDHLLEITGDDVHIILKNGSKLLASGIYCPSGKSLFIHATTYGKEDKAIMGQLVSKHGVTSDNGGDLYAGIGGKNYASTAVPGGTVTIHGGVITATGDYNSPGIGDTVIINGGFVTANGGTGGAGIYNNVTVNGGEVTANGGSSGAGIGSNDGDLKVQKATVTINGGEVTAEGGTFGAGIGGGYHVDNGTVTINGGIVNATGKLSGAGIGGGQNGNGGTVTISLTKAGEKVTATGGTNGAGIGGGASGNGGTVTINSGEVEATGGTSGAGIGSGQGGNGGNLTINGGTVTAAGGEDAAGVGSGSGGKDRSGGKVTLAGGELIATGNGDAAGIGGGRYGDGADLSITGNCTVKTAAGANHTHSIGAGNGSDSQGTFTVVNGMSLIDKQSGRVTWVTDIMNHANAWFTTGTGEITYISHKVENGKAVQLPNEKVSGFKHLYTETLIMDTKDSSFYVASGTMVIPGVITVKGNVNLILENDADITVNGGILIEQGGSLSIYARTETESLMGKLTVNGKDSSAGIGGAGTLTIHGGILDITGGAKAAGIGSSYNGKAGTVTIFGGDVTAKGGEQGAGIGGAAGAAGNTVTVYGGTVVATGGTDAAGIGGGNGGNGGTLTVIDGDVTAYGGSGSNGSAGIGGGYNGNGGTVTVNGGNVTAKGNIFGAGIGGGENGIGDGKHGNGGVITVNDGVVTAKGGEDGAGIGGGSDGIGGTVTVNGGTVTVNGGGFGAGIGGGYNGDGGTMTVSGGTVIAVGGVYAAGIGGGDGGNGGKFILEKTGKVTATGGMNGAGIGGGDGGNGGNVIFNGGSPLTATGGEYAAGIGGGRNGNGANIDLNAACEVKATGGANALRGVGAGNGKVDNGIITTGNGLAVINMKTQKAIMPYNICRESESWFKVQPLTVSYIAYGADGTRLAEDPKVSAFEHVTKDTTTLNGFYVVEETVELDHPLTVNGEAHLILKDDSKLLASGIYCPEGSSLSIYVQSEGEHMGQLETKHGLDEKIDKEYYYAGIGGRAQYIQAAGSIPYQKGGTVTIHGGKITATGDLYCPGIGDHVTIYSSEVHAWGGGSGAGIYGNVNIFDGFVEAHGGNNSAGIGSNSKATGATDCSVYVYGGEVHAWGGDSGAGIGGAYVVNKGYVEISGGEVYAYGGGSAAGIGSGKVPDSEDKGIQILIGNGAYVEAHGNTGSAGIGGAQDGKAGTLLLNGGEVHAYGGANGAGIGGGANCAGGDVTIRSGMVSAEGGNGGAGIGTGSEDGKAILNVTVKGGTVTADGGTNGAGIGSGNSGSSVNVTVSGGNVTANGKENGAGIGGGNNADGGIFTQTGGKVKATGGAGAAGIGGGNNADGGTVILGGGELIATGGTDAAGIGGGNGGNGADLKLTGEITVTAEAGTDTLRAIGAGAGGTSQGTVSASNGIAVRDNNIDQIVMLTNISRDPSVWFTAEVTPVSYYNYEMTDSGEMGLVEHTGFTDYNHVTPFTTKLESGWYVVEETIELDHPLEIAGDVHIILKNGSKLLTSGIYCPSGKSVSVYAQTTDDKAVMGQLVSSHGVTSDNGGDLYAGIGGKNYAKTAVPGGSVTINGGIITATGDYNSPGIGDNVTINGGYVTANGGVNAAGIYNDVTVNGGEIHANGGSGAAGIGSNDGSLSKQKATVTINGGTVTAEGGLNGAGIGGAYDVDNGTVTINGGTVSATGKMNGAGIGGGDNGAGGTVTINLTKEGEKVTATGGAYAAGIGGGSDADGGTVTINGGEVEATGGSDGAGIGGGYNGKGADFTITGGNVTAKGGEDAAGVGSGYGTPDRSSGSVTLAGGELTAIGNGGAAGIGGGENGDAADLYIIGECVINATAGANHTCSIGAGKGTGSQGLIMIPDTMFVIDNNTGEYTSLTTAAAESDISLTIVYDRLFYLAYDNETGELTPAEQIGYKHVDENTAFLTEGWYVVDKNLNFDYPLVVSGNVNLVLADGYKLTANRGIRVESGNSLNVYAQSTAFATMGKMTATSNMDGYAGIGSGPNKPSGDIAFYGGYVIGNGGQQAAGIGGGSGGAGNVTIYGGTIFGNGGASKALSIADANVGGGAGIGGGYNASGNVKIYGGKVNAHGGEGGAAGIGGGAGQNGGCNVLIDGADDITAYGGANAYVSRLFISKSIDVGPGIGGGAGSRNSTVEMREGNVYAMAGENKYVGKLADGDAIKATQIILNPNPGLAIRQTGEDGSILNTYPTKTMLNQLKMTSGYLKSIIKTSRIETDEFEYVIIRGAEQKVVVNAESAVFASDAEFRKFVSVKVDDKTLDAADYDAESGSTVVTLKKAFISTLKLGEHTLEIVSSDGSAKTTFTIVEMPPETGDQNTFMLWIVLLLVAGGALAGLLVFRRRTE